MRFIDYGTLRRSAGGGLPVPSAGQRANISLNDASSVDYDLAISGAGPYDEWWNGYGAYRSFVNMVGAWNGGIYAPDYSTAGGVVVFGGGHGGNQGMFCYVFNLATRQWAQIGAPRNLPASAAWSGFDVAEPNFYNAATDLRDADWYDYDYNGSRISLTDHTYNGVLYVSTAEGGGPDGSIMLITAPLTQEPSLGAKWSPRLLSLTDGTITRALSAAPNISAVTNLINGVKDTSRNRLWYFGQGSSTARYIDLSSGPPYTFSAHTLRDETNATYTAFTEKRTLEYAEGADAIVMFSAPTSLTTDATVSLVVFDMSTGVPVKLNITPPTYTLKHGGQWVAAAWCPPEQAFYLYEGMGDTFCTVLRPSSLDFSTCTWAWSQESFSGPTPPARNTPVGAASSDAWGAFRRFVWDGGTGCFVWHDGPLPTGDVGGVTRNGVVQLWRPPGTVI